MKIKKKMIARSLLALTIVLAIYIVYVAFSIISYSYVDEKIKADVAIVLGAGVWDDKPSPVFTERINHGLWLYANDYVGKLIFTGGRGDGNLRSDASIAREYAIENGIPAEDIYIEEDSAITQENICYAGQIMADNNIATAIIVSDPLHMRRAMLMARDNGLAALLSQRNIFLYRLYMCETFLKEELALHQ